MKGGGGGGQILLMVAAFLAILCDDDTAYTYFLPFEFDNVPEEKKGLVRKAGM